MTDIQVTITDNNASVDVNFAQSIASSIAVHNTDTQSHASILSALTNLNSQVATKANASSVPTKVSQLQNDSSFATTSQIPTVPTLISAFTNDASYATTSQLTSKASTTLNNITQSSALTNLGFAGQSLTTNGYYKFPNGLIIQWGEVTTATTTVTSVTLPTPYTTAHLQCWVCQSTDESSSNTVTGVGCAPNGLTAINIKNLRADSRVNRWLSIGY